MLVCPTKPKQLLIKIVTLILDLMGIFSAFCCNWQHQTAGCVEFGQATYAMIEGADSKATLEEPMFNQMINFTTICIYLWLYIMYAFHMFLSYIIMYKNDCPKTNVLSNVCNFCCYCLGSQHQHLSLSNMYFHGVKSTAHPPIKGALGPISKLTLKFKKQWIIHCQLGNVILETKIT